jgi:hypothetical protein
VASLDKKTDILIGADIPSYERPRAGKILLKPIQATKGHQTRREGEREREREREREKRT